MIMSIGLIISALVIFFVGNPNGYMEDVTEWNAWHLFDPIATYVFSITALLSTLPVIKNAFYLFMEAAPSQINMDQLCKKYRAIPGVAVLKRVNVWELKPGKVCLIARARVKKGYKRSVLVAMTDIARERRIFHTAFQVEELD